MKNDTDLLEYFVANERKQKKITTITAILFSLFALIIIGLGVVAYKQKVAIETKKKNIFRLNDSLMKVTHQLDSLNALLNQEKITLSRNATYYEVQNKVINSQLEKIAVADSLEPVNPATTNSKTSHQIKVLKNWITNNQKTNYTIYIQHIADKKFEAQKLKDILLKEKFTIPPLQNMKQLKFKSCVRYFYSTDKEKADEVARILEQATDQDYEVQFLKLKSPKNQLEVWVGN